MYIRCPNCGRRGHLPDRLAPEASSLRCRKCKAHFLTPELSLAGSRGGVEQAEGGRAREQARPFAGEDFFSAFVDDGEIERELGPGDSNYELPFSLRDGMRDRGDGWVAVDMAMEPEAPSSDEIEAIAPTAELAVQDTIRPRTPVDRLLAWGRIAWMGLLLGLIAAGTPVVVHLVWRAVSSGTESPSPSPTLVAGLACALALLMLAVPLSLLAGMLPEGLIARLRPREGSAATS